MSVDELIDKLQDIINKMEYVKDGDFVFARHPNLFVDWLKDAITVCNDLYEKFKVKTGKTLPDVEEWLDMAEIRFGFTRKVKFGDLVLTKDHNLIIDIMKPLELALKRMEESL